MAAKTPRKTGAGVPEADEHAVRQTLAPYEVAPRPAANLFAGSYEADPRDKIAEIRRGVPARRIGELSSLMDMSKESLMDFLGLSRATVNRKAQQDQPLSRGESERVLGVQTLIGQVQAMVEGAGTSGFDAARWVSRWLGEPLPALGGERPADYMDTVEGQKLVGRLLAMAGSGAYA